MAKSRKIVIIILILVIGIFLYHYIRIKTAKIAIRLADNLTAEFNSEVRVSDFISSINGKIIDNYKIKTTKLGSKKVEFKFINDEKIKLKYSFDIQVVDTEKPVVLLKDRYNVEVGSDIDLEKTILCGDNYDKNPRCFIDGEYDLNVVGEYNLLYKAIDSSGNTLEKPFVLNVSSLANAKNEEKETLFSDVLNNYKTANNKIGLDISKWQGNIDFQKIKKAGVEFLMLRVGGTRGNNGKFFVDEKFISNIKKANKEKIPVGIYFYSYASSSSQAKKEAEWVIKKIKKYNIDLPIAYDWEHWHDFNEYNLSFFGLSSMAETFMKTIEKAGYKGMLYSSKAYLENIWFETKYDTWLAHYTAETDYNKDYKMWQICSNGHIDGINGPVDIDIMY